MILLPIETPDHKNDAVIVILRPDNLERMKEGDPAEISLRQSSKTLLNPTLLICYEEEMPQLSQLIHSGDLKAIVKYLQRGWKFRPDRGDHDRGLEHLSEGN